MTRAKSPSLRKERERLGHPPYADPENPQSLNLYGYVANNPLSRRDVDGHSYLVYDGSANTLTLYSASGEVLGVYPANNNVDSASSLGPLPDGTYPMQDQNSPYTHGNQVDDNDSELKDSENGEFGPGGIFRVQYFKGPDGKIHRGIGVHAGRKNKPDLRGRKGPAHATKGCIRTCDTAIQKITSTAKTDPLTSLSVVFNDPEDKGTVTTSQGPATPCGGNTGRPMSQINVRGFDGEPSVKASGWLVKAGIKAAFCAILCLCLQLKIFADHPPPEYIAVGKPEQVLAGISIAKDTVASAMLRMRPPDKFEESVSSDLSGERSYEWNRDGIRLRMHTEFYTDKKAMTLVESSPISVDIWGQHSDPKVGVTGSGLSLGDDLAKVKKVYGNRFATDPHSVTLQWKNGTALSIDFSDDGHIIHMQLMASEE